MNCPNFCSRVNGPLCISQRSEFCTESNGCMADQPSSTPPHLWYCHIDIRHAALHAWRGQRHCALDGRHGREQILILGFEKIVLSHSIEAPSHRLRRERA